MSNLVGSLDIEIWDFIGIWCLEFEISEYLLRAFKPGTLNPYMKLRQNGTVSFLIKLGVPPASGRAEH